MYNIEELIQNNDLLGFAERAGAVFKKTGGEYRSHCPLHGGKNGSGFAVWFEDGKQKWMCFTDTCGSGDLLDFIQKWQGKTFQQAIDFLGGKTILDPAEMLRLADERHKRAVVEAEKARKLEEARRAELQSERKHLFYHDNMNAYMIEQWVARGLDECWQGFWSLGGCSDFIVNNGWHTPTLTIPIINEKFEVLNIRHRLLNPPEPKDKYRPEKPGLGTSPFMAYPDLGYDKADTYWVIEGEIKGAVTATITPESTWQFFGVPGMKQYGALVDKLFGKNVVVVSDPGAEDTTREFCKKVNGRFVELSEKIDDLIVASKLDGDWLRSIEKQARRVKA